MRFIAAGVWEVIDLHECLVNERFIQMQRIGRILAMGEAYRLLNRVHRVRVLVRLPLDRALCIAARWMRSEALRRQPCIRQTIEFQGRKNGGAVQDSHLELEFRRNLQFCSQLGRLSSSKKTSTLQASPSIFEDMRCCPVTPWQEAFRMHPSWDGC